MRSPAASTSTPMMTRTSFTDDDAAACTERAIGADGADTRWKGLVAAAMASTARLDKYHSSVLLASLQHRDLESLLTPDHCHTHTHTHSLSHSITHTHSLSLTRSHPRIHSVPIQIRDG
jgi:hypothetical protein